MTWIDKFNAMKIALKSFHPFGFLQNITTRKFAKSSPFHEQGSDQCRKERFLGLN